MVAPRFTVDGVHFDPNEGQTGMNCAFRERLDELEVNLFDIGVLIVDAAADVRVISNFVHPSLETRSVSVPAVSETVRTSRDPEAKLDVMEWLG